MNEIDLSVVVPAYNEEENLPLLLQRLTKILSDLTAAYEVIVVNDGSTDKTSEVIARESQIINNIKLINLSRNFGHQAALNAGLDYATGKAVVTIDADLQQPPELIREMYQKFKEGYDLVLAVRGEKNESSSFKSVTASIFYRLMNKINDFELRANVADFNLYDRQVVETLKQLPEKDRFLRGLVQWIGFEKCYLTYEVADRQHGKSKYSFRKMLRLAISGITSFSAFPLRVAWLVGLFISLCGFLYGGYILYEYLYNANRIVTGWTSSIVVVLIIGGTQLMIMGITGEYLFKMFYEIKGRPLYIVKNTKGLVKTNNNKYGINTEV